MQNPTQKNSGAELVLWCILAVPVAWFAAIFAQCVEDEATIFTLLDNLTLALQTPFALRWTDRTAACILAAVLLYACGVAYMRTTGGNTRTGEEHGSARWGDPRPINRKYADKDPANNIILTQNVRLGMDGRTHMRNQNTLIIGGSGSGKTRFFCKPNVMQASNSSPESRGSSYLITDPKGKILRDVGPLLQAEGYDIKVLDLLHLERSDCFNPFHYLRTDADVLRLITNLIQATTPKESKSNDPFWDKAEQALLSALMLYLMHEAPRNEQNFSTLIYLLENAAASEDEEVQTPVDVLFQALEEDNPQHIAVKQYKVFKQATGKTAKSILVSAAVRLAPLSLPEMQRITNRDDLDLGSLGERKRAIFALIPDNDTTLNFFVSMLYTLAVQALYSMADDEHGGRLPVPVRLIMDEFANVAQPPEFEKVLATCRSRAISINIIIQSLAQLKSMFKDSWENVTGLCDCILYLGGNEQSTHEYFSKSLGKATIDTTTRGITKGRSGSSSQNFQHAGRELMTPDEVRMMDNKFALLFIRGERPIMDFKYDLMQHPNIKRTADGGVPPYIRASHSYEQPDLSFPFESLDDIEIIEP